MKEYFHYLLGAQNHRLVKEGASGGHQPSLWSKQGQFQSRIWLQTWIKLLRTTSRCSRLNSWHFPCPVYGWYREKPLSSLGVCTRGKVCWAVGQNLRHFRWTLGLQVTVTEGGHPGWHGSSLCKKWAGRKGVGVARFWDPGVDKWIYVQIYIIYIYVCKWPAPEPLSGIVFLLAVWGKYPGDSSSLKITES